MLKIRITFVDSEKGRAELDSAISTLEKEYDVLNKSRIYEGRGNSQYSNIYLDVEEK